MLCPHFNQHFPLHIIFIQMKFLAPLEMYFFNFGTIRTHHNCFCTIFFTQSLGLLCFFYFSFMVQGLVPYTTEKIQIMISSFHVVLQYFLVEAKNTIEEVEQKIPL